MAWEEYLAIAREAAQEARDERTRPPSACPYDGEPLRRGPNNELYCPWGNYSYPRDGRL